jgi:hypothetical protein
MFEKWPDFNVLPVDRALLLREAPALTSRSTSVAAGWIFRLKPEATTG